MYFLIVKLALCDLHWARGGFCSNIRCAKADDCRRLHLGRFGLVAYPPTGATLQITLGSPRRPCPSPPRQFSSTTEYSVFMPLQKAIPHRHLTGCSPFFLQKRRAYGTYIALMAG